jgi:hypothetical protein
MSKDPAQNKPVAPAGGKPAGKPMGTKKPGPTKKHEAHEEVPAGPRVPPRLLVAYNDKVRAAFA